MKNVIKVHVTIEDLVTSKYVDSDDCALAKALKRKLPSSGVKVGGDFALIDGMEYDIDEKSGDRLVVSCGKENKHGFYVTLTPTF